MTAARTTSIATIVAVNLLGVAAFAYPFFLPELAQRGESFAHASDAPILFAIFGAALIGVALSAARAGQLDAKGIAVLGVLAGINAVLRLPGSLGGASLMFILPILSGAAFGPSFGFLLGATSMAASGVITGGVGPWLPFQMWALGWVGGGAGLLGPAVRGRSPRVVAASIAAYAWVASIVFGALLNLWFWPYLGGASDVSWVPGVGLADGMATYWRFYVATSLAWDSARAILNVLLILALGRPILHLLGKFRARLTVTWSEGTVEAR